MTEIYADLLLVVNLIMNYAVLWAAGRLSALRSTWLRLFTASGIGAIYALIVVTNTIPPLASPVASVLLSLIMLAIAYRPATIGSWARVTGCFYLAAVTAGGTAIAVHWLILPRIGGLIPLLAAGSGACIVLGRTAVSVARRSQWERMLTADVRITLGGKTITISGLIDTGNRLRDPLSGAHVIVVEPSILARLTPASMRHVWYKSGSLNLTGSHQLLKRFRAIPYRTLDRSGVMYGLRPDRVVIIDGSARVVHDNVVLASSPGPISGEGRVAALIPSELVWNSSDDGGRLQTVRVVRGGDD